VEVLFMLVVIAVGVAVDDFVRNKEETVEEDARRNLL
jgi:hypothetical protein